MSSASSGDKPQAGHHRHVLHLQFVAVIRAPAVFEIELVGKPLLRVILRADIFLFVRTIGTRALARVMNPADQVIVIRFFADAAQIRGKRSTMHLIAFANGVASEASARLKQFFSVFGVPRLMFGKRIGESLTARCTPRSPESDARSGGSSASS